MALSTATNIFVHETLPTTDGSGGYFRAPLLAVSWSVNTDDSVNAFLQVSNSTGIQAVASFLITTAEIDAVTITLSGRRAIIREAIEKVVRDRLNTLNGTTVITWS